MFDTLTVPELSRLAAKLGSACIALAEPAHALHAFTMTLKDTGQITVCGPEWETLVSIRRTFGDASTEAFDLMTEADTAAAALRAKDTTHA